MTDNKDEMGEGSKNETLRVKVAKAALMEAGRPDLANMVEANRRGDPKINYTPQGDEGVVKKAFRLAHQIDPDGAPVLCMQDPRWHEVDQQRGIMTLHDGDCCSTFNE